MALERLAKSHPLIPPETKAAIREGTLHLPGTAPYEWLPPRSAQQPKLPGISRISEEKLQTAYDAGLVLQRFIGHFNLPDSVNASVNNGVLLPPPGTPSLAHWVRRVASISRY